MPEVLAKVHSGAHTRPAFSHCIHAWSVALLTSGSNHLLQEKLHQISTLLAPTLSIILSNGHIRTRLPFNSSRG